MLLSCFSLVERKNDTEPPPVTPEVLRGDTSEPRTSIDSRFLRVCLLPLFLDVLTSITAVILVGCIYIFMLSYVHVGTEYVPNVVGRALGTSDNA